jgi:hypothetical protein
LTDINLPHLTPISLRQDPHEAVSLFHLKSDLLTDSSPVP